MRDGNKGGVLGMEMGDYDMGYNDGFDRWINLIKVGVNLIYF